MSSNPFPTTMSAMTPAIEASLYAAGPTCGDTCFGLRYEIGRIEYDAFRSEVLVLVRSCHEKGIDPLRVLNVGAGLGGSCRGVLSAIRSVVRLPQVVLEETNLTPPPGYSPNSSFLDIVPRYGFRIDAPYCTDDLQSIPHYQLILMERVLEWCTDPTLALKNTLSLAGDGLAIVITPDRFNNLGGRTIIDLLAEVNPTLLRIKTKSVPTIFPNQPQ